MFRTAIDSLNRSFRTVRDAVREWRQRRLAALTEKESREREVLVNELAKKFDQAHADCEQNRKPFTTIELSLKEIIFIKWNLETWVRHFKERKIYRPSPQSKTQS
jgi:transposase